MLYNSLKTFHILSATLLLIGITICCRLWLKSKDSTTIFQQVQTQTMLVIIPFAILQLASGFSMISMKHYELSQTWIFGSVIGFFTLIVSWFAFVFSLLLSRENQNNQKILRRTQSALLLLCTISLLCMIFFMANKI